MKKHRLMSSKWKERNSTVLKGPRCSFPVAHYCITSLFITLLYISIRENTLFLIIRTLLRVLLGCITLLADGSGCDFWHARES